MELLSIIVPCFNEEAAVETFYTHTSAVCETLPEIRVEYIFVDDGSRDGTLSVVKKLAERDGAVRVEFDEPQRAVTGGQSLVCYHGDWGVLVVGGGIITGAE